MTYEEFIKQIKEFKFIDSPEECINYKYPIIQYYFKNLMNVTITILDQQRGPTLLNSNQIMINRPRSNEHHNFTAMNMIFDFIKNKYK
jgi:hypothetical protein